MANNLGPNLRGAATSNHNFQFIAQEEASDNSHSNAITKSLLHSLSDIEEEFPLKTELSKVEELSRAGSSVSEDGSSRSDVSGDQSKLSGKLFRNTNPIKDLENTPQMGSLDFNKNQTGQSGSSKTPKLGSSYFIKESQYPLAKPNQNQTLPDGSDSELMEKFNRSFIKIGEITEQRQKK